MFDVTKYDYLILDCDGVILDSNHLKSNAFNEALPREPAYLVRKFLDYHKKHGGISRYEKFDYYFREIKQSSSVDKNARDAINRFSSIVKEGLTKCEYVPGVLDFIKYAKLHGIPMFVVSGSDENELIDVFEERGIASFFDKIYGSPVGKNDNTNKVVEMFFYKKNGCFFGDSRADYVAASAYGLDFVFVSQFSEWKVNCNLRNSIDTIKNFTEI